MTTKEFRLPDVGEGLTEAEILNWHVSVGDQVELNQVIVEVETAKAVVDLPCPFAGTVTEIHVAAGTPVPVGTALISVAVDETVSAPANVVEPADNRPPPVLVGSGPRDAAQRRFRINPRPRAQAPERPPATSNHSPGLPRETRIPIKSVRKVTAAAMTRSAFTAPHVTEWLAADVTATMHAVARLKSDPAWAGVRITPMLFVARAFLLAIRSFPEINASWDEDGQEIVVKNYVNLGIAVATPRGLIVPNVKDADRMDLRQLATSLDALIATARDGKTPPADMSSGTVTITNIGAFGVDAGTPILNPGEAAILAFGAIRPMPWVRDDQLCVRQVTQLAMSFDHRLVDGELGSKVLARVAGLLTDPGAAFLYA